MMSNHPDCVISTPLIELTLPPPGMSLWLSANDKRIVKDKKGRVMMWPDKSGNGRSMMNPHYHPMQRIRQTWWPS